MVGSVCAFLHFLLGERIIRPVLMMVGAVAAAAADAD